jgi:FKBP-type peptidyl-prolyl cis-trans isomerase
MLKNRQAMNKTAIILLFAALFLSSCIKEPEDPIQKEQTERNQYLLDNNITTTPTETGLYYLETLTGTGAYPSEGVKVKVAYTGTLLNGTEFDSGEFEFRFDFNQTIQGFNEAVGYMRKGGTATAIIPSYLAYGSYSVNDIPSYSTLVFDLELLEVYGQEKEIEDRNQYLVDNSIETEPTTSGLYYIETLTGTGETPEADDVLEVIYEGKYLDDEVFDSGTYTFTYGAGEAIQGFDEGLGLMKEGGKATLIIPSNLAYGSVGNSVIAGFTTLVFDVELVSITKPE